MAIKIEGYLVQRKLEAALKEIVGDAWVGSEVAIPQSRFRWDMVYEHEGKKVAVEFDEDRHYRDSLVIKRDREKDVPELKHGKLKKKTMELVTAFIHLNKAVLLSYWKGKIDTAELTSRLKPVPLRVPKV